MKIKLIKNFTYASVLLSSFILQSCKGHSDVENPAPDDLDSLAAANMAAVDTTVDVTDLYDSTFVDQVAELDSSVKFVDSLIIAGKDTVKFPGDLPLAKKIIFTGRKNNNSYKLIVFRYNLTDLNYYFEQTNAAGELLADMSGKAILSPSFFMTAEADHDDKTGATYTSYEYRDRSTDCWMSIRVGVGTDQQKMKRATTVLECKDNSTAPINLKDCPTLRAQ